MSDLITNFKNSVKSETYPVVIERMNAALGTTYKANRLSEWGRTRNVPDNVRRYMLSVVIRDVLTGAGICPRSLNDKKTEQIICGLMPNFK